MFLSWGFILVASLKGLFTTGWFAAWCCGLIWVVFTGRSFVALWLKGSWKSAEKGSWSMQKRLWASFVLAYAEKWDGEVFQSLKWLVFISAILCNYLFPSASVWLKIVQMSACPAASCKILTVSSVVSHKCVQGLVITISTWDAQCCVVSWLSSDLQCVVGGGRAFCFGLCPVLP